MTTVFSLGSDSMDAFACVSEVVICGATDLFRFDVLRCGEDVRVRGALKDPVQRFQLLLGEGVCPKVFP